jgi:hypothetical protein
MAVGDARSPPVVVSLTTCEGEEGLVAVNGDTQVVITMGQLIIGATGFLAALAGVLWAVLRFTVGGMRDDVRDIRNSIRELVSADRALAEQVQGVRIEQATLSGKMDRLQQAIDYFIKQVSQFFPRSR